MTRIIEPAVWERRMRFVTEMGMAGPYQLRVCAAVADQIRLAVKEAKLDDRIRTVIGMKDWTDAQWRLEPLNQTTMEDEKC